MLPRERGEGRRAWVHKNNLIQGFWAPAPWEKSVWGSGTKARATPGHVDHFPQGRHMELDRLGANHLRQGQLSSRRCPEVMGRSESSSLQSPLGYSSWGLVWVFRDSLSLNVLELFKGG